ncbi:MAG: galactokinase [Clostridiales bacterium]|nr:galactokinase [Clostridiales bacterium]
MQTSPTAKNAFASQEASLSVRFAHTFSCPPEAFFSVPGRTELGGNHTDHQHGHVLAAAVDLDTRAAVRRNGTGTIHIHSEGYTPFAVDLTRLSPVSEERFTSAALVRGIAAKFKALGCPMEKAGFDACLSSGVPPGSGLSSSAAFEVLIALIFNALFFANSLSPEDLAKIGQYAENEFFGKPCGLMDQMACALGGVVAIDFADPAAPKAERIAFDLSRFGYALFIIDSGAGHADLTSEYAAITDELRAVSRFFGKEHLRHVGKEAFYGALPRLRRETGDRAVLRAMHFFEEDARAVREAEALKAGDIGGFLSLVRESSRSSAIYLQNIVPGGQVKNQELLFTLALAESVLCGAGAVRVHGGGFGGTAQAFVPLTHADRFQSKIETVLGDGSCRRLSFRAAGALQIDK